MGTEFTRDAPGRSLAIKKAVLAGLAASPLALAAGSSLSFGQPTSGTLSIAVLDWAETGIKPVFACLLYTSPSPRD